MILMIDNYDSFVFNLVLYIKELDKQVCVYRNDQITVEHIKKLAPTHILLSPGPCAPSQAGICLEVIQTFAGKVPILGICLGHQAIGQAFGAKVKRALKPIHGKTSFVDHKSQGIFKGLPSPMRVTRYHSLIVDHEMLPDSLDVTAVSKEGEIMALTHRTLPVVGVQFHPEAILSEHGHALLQNFLTGNYR